ncbi:spore coat protein U-like protein [Variovorax paradoxus]|jgi:spore coat protein U-like protein|uniref:Csu type fimbrial protein n=1 Tax=Variovorax paradoxus TaxID=34073 RepID=UPI00278CEDC7|nr:spore coat U domain-containing protein [Variovorax paradoxus]MDQ0572830.1 spore coat protein U-like protein [Variovorax paradoxus]
MSFLTRTLQALRLPMLCALLWWLPAGSAQAAVSCTATMTNLAFGTVELVDGAASSSVNATLNYTCTNDGTAAVQARVCFNIGDGNQSLGNFNPRTMKDSAGNILNFQLYQSTSGTVWGSNGNGAVPNPFIATMSIAARPFLGGVTSVSGSTTMRGQLLALQSTVPPGTYQDDFAGDHTSITLSSSTSAMPTTCNTILPDKFAFVVSATVAKSCLVTADPLNFGTINGLPGQADRDQTSTINVTCTTPTPYTVALTPSNGSTTGAGTMTPTGGVPGNADTVPYRLYRNAARTTVWGSVTGTNTAAGTGNGAAQALTLYGRVLGTSANVRPDSYRDVVTVSVTY